jgi:TM2 domain-containing membrane protein YozV/SpoVK/Ycf46/Vps4 family AAA+-type ATPase
MNATQPSPTTTQNPIVPRQPRSKQTAAVLALLLGFFGIHRFYLRRHWAAFFSILFCWTFIPLLASLIDAIIFFTMSDEDFDKNYNQPPKYCASCGKHLTMLNTPVFDAGKLSDGERICFDCYQALAPIDTKKYDSVSIKKELDKKPNAPTNQQFSPKYLLPLSKFVKELLDMYSKILSNNNIVTQLNGSGQLNMPLNDFVRTAMLFDLVQTCKMLCPDKLIRNTLESSGLAIVASSLLRNVPTYTEKTPYSIVKAHLNGELLYLTKQLLSKANAEDNPIKVNAEIKDGDRLISKHQNKNNFAFPAFLCITDNPLLDEYASLLHRFATIIAEADGAITDSEEKTLKKIYQRVHYPVPEKRNDSLHVSQNDADNSLDDVLAELNSLIGLEVVKSEIRKLIDFIKIQKARGKTGLKTSPISYHIVFTGNPGTGKTTVARIVAKIYKHLGILSKGHLVETDRSGLIAEYSGQTAVKTNKTVDSALDGVLFIDEAYALVGENKDDFGKEAVATLIKRMEDDRSRLVVILAGYTGEMATFIDTNPGMQSRFNRYIDFPDYSSDELFAIFESRCQKSEYRLTLGASRKVKALLKEAYSQRDKTFGNARLVRNLFEKTIERQAGRIAKVAELNKDILTEIREEDIL